ncbi:MAG: AgmX/PglI C-terminal domain-containing protein [Polyangiales bacterium]
MTNTPRLSLSILLALAGCGAKKEAQSPKPVEYVEAVALVGFEGSDPQPLENDKALEAAQAVIEKETLRIKGCYERALEADKTTSGMVMVKLDMDDTGAPKVKVLCSSVPAELTTCIVQSFEAMRFEPPPSGKKSLTLPVFMQPKGAPKAPACNADPGGTKL